MSKVTKNQPNPTLNCVEQSSGSSILTFITDCDKKIDVLEADLLGFIDASGLNISYEGEGLVCDPHGTEAEVITDVSIYLDNNFENVTKMYFDQVLLLTMKEASQFMQGYASSLVKQGLPIDEANIGMMLSHVQNEYGVRMEVA